MALDFTIPTNLAPETRQSLVQLIAEFQDGYLTEKGYIKKRHELLLVQGGHSSRSSVTRSSFRDSMISRGSTSVDLGYDPDFFVSPGGANTTYTASSSGGSPSTNQQLELADLVDMGPEDAQEYYDSQLNAPVADSGVRRELQRPLDPRVLEQYMQTETLDNLSMILRKRAATYAKEPALLVLNHRGKDTQSLSWEKLYQRAEKVAKQIKTKAALYPGDRVCLLYQNVEAADFLVALYGCLLSGTVAVPMNTGLPVKDLVQIMTDTQSHLCLMSDSVYRHFDKLSHKRKVSLWPRGVDVWKTSVMGTYQPSRKDDPPPLKISDLAYIEYSRGSTSELKGVAISHRTVIHQMTSLASILASSPDIKKDTLIRPAGRYTRTRQLILSTLDIRESIGLIVGALFTVYSGNTLLWIHQRTTEIPGLYANIISRFRASILLSDYLTLKQVAYNYQSFPQLTRMFNKKIKVDLSSVKWCLINTLTVDCEFDDKLSDRWFKPLGHPHPRRIIAPMLCLSEHGGAMISIRDWVGKEELLGTNFQKPMTEEVIGGDEYEDDGSMGERLSEVLIDKESLTTNTVKVVSDRPPPTSTTYYDESSKYIRVGAFGYPIPDATLAVVNPELKVLSATLEVGEIWVDSNCISGGYWGLPEETQAIFQAECADYEGVLNLNFVRTGLLGFIYNGKVYVLGLYEDRINQDVTWYDEYLEKKAKNEEEDEEEDSSTNAVLPQPNLKYRYHYASHLVRTLVRNIPEVTDCSLFNVRVNGEFLPVAIIETPAASASGEKAGTAARIDTSQLNDMAVQAIKIIENFHKVRLFCVMVTAPDTLPRTVRSGRKEIANMLCRRRFMEGRLAAQFVRFNFANSLATIHHGGDIAGGIWSPYSSQVRADSLANSQLQYSGLDMRETCTDDRTNMALTDYTNLIELLKVRGSQRPDELAFAVLEGGNVKEVKPLSWRKFENRVFAVCQYILEKPNLQAGDCVVLVYHLSEEYVICLYACWLAGFVVLPIPPLDPRLAQEDALSLVQLVKENDAKAIFVSTEVEQTLKSKPLSTKIKQTALTTHVLLPKYRNTSKHTKCALSGKVMYPKMEQYRKRARRATKECLLWVTWTADHRHQCSRLTFANLLPLAMNLKETCQMSSTKPLVGCVRHTSGLGFMQACVMGVYLGCTTYLFSAADYGLNASAYWSSLARYGIENSYVTSRMLTHAIHTMKSVRCNLSHLKNLMVGWEGRPNVAELEMFRDAFQPSEMPNTAVSDVYQHLLNPMITSHSFLPFEPVNLCLDPLALAQGYISLVNPADSPDSIVVQDSGIVPVNTQIAVVNPESREVCKVGEFGEIWVCSQSTLSGFAGKNTEMVHGTIKDWDEDISYLRTGDFGFLHTIQTQVNESDQDVELQLLYNLGKIEETFEVLGLQYFASDIEATFKRFSVVSEACVFKAGSYVVAVLETSLKHNFASLVPLLVMKIMNKFKLVVDVISFAGEARIPLSRLGTIQRTTAIQLWLDGKLGLIASFGTNFGEGSSIKTLNMIQDVTGVEIA